MAKTDKVDPQTGEVLDDSEADIGRALVKVTDDISIEGVDSSLAVALTRQEIDVQIATAKAYPRDMARAVRQTISLALTDTETATECLYAIPRDGKMIMGPSIRLAELIAQQWGNNRVYEYGCGRQGAAPDHQ